MTTEKFEFKSEKKPLKEGSNYLGISMTNGLKCASSCINEAIDANQNVLLNFLWYFNWDELNKRGINRLSGHIIVQAYDKTSSYKVMNDVKFDVDLKESNQIISNFFKASGLNCDDLVMFEYSLTPYDTPIEEIKEESMFMLTPSELNDAILYLSCHSEFFHAIFSSNYKEGQMDEIPIEGISYNDFKLLLGTISPKTVFPTDKTVEKLLELATRFMMPSVIAHVEHHLLHISKIENERKMLMGEQYGMKEVLAKAILEMDTIEKARKWKQSPEYNNFSYETKTRVLEKFI